MKKHSLFIALLLGTMTGCSGNDKPRKVAIQLQENSELKAISA